MTPGLSLREVDFLGSYSSRLIQQWNNPYTLARPQICIHTLILEHCRSQPDAEALCAWDGSITYAELDKFSLAVALQLLSIGVGPESVVPLYFEKSSWTAVAILGVLRAGSAFVLLDPSHPMTRLVDICSEVQAKVAIVWDSLQELGRQLGPRVITLLDTIKSHVDTRRKPFNTQVKPSNAAYIAFTSGSTGKPKGIVIEHQCFVANTLAQNAVQNINHQTRAFQFASYGFDSSILETLMTLVAGGCVCIPSEEQRLNGLADAIRGMRANWLELTPSVARFINPEEVPHVKSVLLVGEPMSQDHIKQWSGSRKIQLLNAYGPAECSVVATIQPHVEVEDPQNIGRSYSSHCWIVNPQDHDQLEPLGAVGELLISGPIVARGYLNQPHQKSFISNPRWATRFGIPPGERVYKTGDLVRYNVDDGALRYVGRKDREVKIHGQRVDLQEIEHHASQFQKGILAVADVIQVNGSSAGKLLALFISADNDDTRPTKHSFVVPMNDTLLDLVTDLKHWLRDCLPPYMIPTKYMFVNRFPLTRTSKLDRRALIDLAASSHPPTGEHPSKQRDREDVELDPELFAKRKILCSVFAEALGCPERNIGAEDGFYDMGGNSLAAIELVARARKRGLEITVADVIRLQSPRDIARCTVESKGVHEISPFSLLVDPEQSLSAATAQCGVERATIEDIYPCTPLQEGLMHLSIITPGAFMGTYRFSLAPSTNLHRIWAAWEQLWLVHPILRTRIIQLQDGQKLQVVIMQKLPRKDILVVDDCEPMSLGTPLARLTFHPGRACGGSDSGMFILTMHHALFDGWSYLQLLEDLQVIYNGDRLPPRPAFNHVINYISNLKIEEGHSFWRQQFNDLQATMFPISSRRSIALVLSAAVLICLAVAFSACTSTSSPQDLFFMEVNLTKFPKTDHLNLVRSFDLPGVGNSSSLQQRNVVDSITGSAENTVSQIGGHVQDLSDQLHSLLPEYYAVGLWGYCEGKRGAPTFSNCTGPSASFSFDLVDILSSRLGQANGVLADWTQPVLKGYRRVSHWIVAAYMMAFIAAFIAVVTGLVGFPLAKLVAIISSAYVGASGHLCQSWTTDAGHIMDRRGVLGGFQFVLDCGKMLLLLSLRGQVLALQGGMKGEVHLRSSL
ncbi:hypothetical protein CBS147333_9064 [Penicillium roqueforti]|nr:hypothetical protein CBS147333_9064 [Penicillium roqueforti]KAI3196687.1 hypothetical protein CBS147311_7291 [Penicillium roqueforti]KAI3262404.1 hypothetical protein CBS147308_9205 [Penicillium roqueforti]KAI3281236.1 hypothetical protein DTO003C3_9043 [Penicillium roqueforti]